MPNSSFMSITVTCSQALIYVEHHMLQLVTSSFFRNLSKKNILIGEKYDFGLVLKMNSGLQNGSFIKKNFIV